MRRIWTLSTECARPGCSLHGPAEVRRSAESQRDSGTKPRVARDELPWGNRDNEHNPERVAAPCEGKKVSGRNLVVVVVAGGGVPWVAGSSQPWAGSHNPVGIGDACKEQRPPAQQAPAWQAGGSISTLAGLRTLLRPGTGALRPSRPLWWSCPEACPEQRPRMAARTLR